MSKIVFRNHNKLAIKKLLLEIGKERYEEALKDSSIPHKPLSMEGFFVEYDVKTQDIGLFYKYPSRIEFYIMPVLGYWAIPQNDWIITRQD